MEMLTKLGDAASMFWSALDDRERLILLYVGFAVVLVVEVTARAAREREREQRIADMVRQEIHAARS